MTVRGGEVIGPHGSITLGEVARTWYLKPQNLPTDVDMGGMEATIGYRPNPDTGTFSYATHAAIVAVYLEIGKVEILDYVVVEDGGKLVNPMVVDGQIFGGLAQGIGTALYEEMPFDSAGQPLASTLADYLLPGPTEVPAVRIDHMETLSPYTEFGVKGIGEGGADRTRRRPSPMPSMMRCCWGALSCSFRRSRPAGCSRQSPAARAMTRHATNNAIRRELTSCRETSHRRLVIGPSALIRDVSKVPATWPGQHDRAAPACPDAPCAQTLPSAAAALCQPR